MWNFKQIRNKATDNRLAIISSLLLLCVLVFGLLFTGCVPIKDASVDKMECKDGYLYRSSASKSEIIREDKNFVPCDKGIVRLKDK